MGGTHRLSRKRDRKKSRQPRREGKPRRLKQKGRMTELRIENYTIPASVLGGKNPLPDLPAPPAPDAPSAFDPNMTEAERAFQKAAEVRGCLPYRIQDAYDRSEAPRPLRAAVLENERLRATFLLELGGRLWSLYHKARRRELLYQPKVLHFANVALRNAWFAGGVEWNVAVRGHAAYTCSPVFASRVVAGDGSPVLRLHEFDRFRGFLFQIDFLMPGGEAMLLVRPRLLNPHAETAAAYWWSNIAVEEAEGHRVVVPADRAYHYGYQGRMEEVAVPVRDGIDTSYPARLPTARDCFYRIPPGNRPWIASLDGGGAGLVHASTARLKSRKLFVWGMGPGGRRWQQHLGGRGTAYVEIQGGLARTQSEYAAMPARADWSWTEAYMLMEADPAVVHGADWTASHRHVQERLDALLPQARLEALHGETAALADRRPEEILFRGSGWGALEARRRGADGEPGNGVPRAVLSGRAESPGAEARRDKARRGTPPSGTLNGCDLPASPPSLVFDDASLGEDQAPWLALLGQGALPVRDPADAPGAWMTAAPWRRRLAESARTPAGDHWLTWLHLGVAAHRAGEMAEAAEAWQQSLARQPSAWAYRNLAVLARHQGRAGEAADLYLRAAELKPDLPELQTECGQALTEAGRFADLDRWLDGLPQAVRRSGRIEMLAARAATERGDLAGAEAILERIELADVREGEIALTDLWFSIQEKRLAAAEGVPIDDALKERVRRTLQPPKRLDYRMSQA